MPPFLNSDVRLWLYGVYTSAIPLLIFYGHTSKESLPLWIALGASLLGQGQAATSLIAQRRTGQVEPRRKPKSKRIGQAGTPAEAP